MYRVTIDRDACEGIFACLVRDDRFVEGGEGLASFDTAEADRVREREDAVVAEFDDDRIETARQAAAACPPSAITVEEIAESEADAGGREVEACR
jgi:ferredoxin